MVVLQRNLLFKTSTLSSEIQSLPHVLERSDAKRKKKITRTRVSLNTAIASAAKLAAKEEAGMPRVSIILTENAFSQQIYTTRLARSLENQPTNK